MSSIKSVASPPCASDINFILRQDLLSFTRHTFGVLHPEAQFFEAGHLALVAAKLESCLRGDCRRLIICLPPRSLKSILASVAFPAWALGKEPHKQIICASYGQDLAEKHARDTRNVMLSTGYLNAFGTRLLGNRSAVNDLTTTQRGFRMATSVGGTLTGRGGDLLIIDDPLKPQEAYSETLRSGVNHWFDNTLLSRLNNKRDGVIIVVMQRLHQDDLVGHLLEGGGWEVLRLPAIAEEDESLTAVNWMGPVPFNRRAGEVLDSRRDSRSALEQLRAAMGSYAFEAQYQQNPQPVGGAIIKTHWLCRYTPAELPEHFPYKIQSWDTANKSGELNDYSVCTTWGSIKRTFYLLDVFRQRLEYPDLRRAVEAQYSKHRPSRILIEDKGSGTQLLQDIHLPMRGYTPPPGSDKQMRLFAQSAAFENGKVFLPSSAPWLDEYVRELTSFPGTKHDDQVDSTTQALDHLTKASSSGFRVYELAT